MKEDPQAASSAPATVDPKLVEDAMREILNGSGEYNDVLVKIRDKRPVSEILVEAPELIGEIIRDARATIPAIGATTNVLKEGTQTSEYRNMSVVGRIFTILMILAPVLDGIVSALHESQFFGSGFVVTTILAVLKAMMANSYNAGRVAIKTAAVGNEKNPLG